MIRIVCFVSRVIGFCIFAFGITLAAFAKTFAGPDAMAASAMICTAMPFILVPKFIEDRARRHAAS